MMLIDDGMVLMLRRANTGYEDGKYTFPSGHIDKGESPISAAVRETEEETGLSINPEHVEFALIVARKKSNEEEWADYFFVANHWAGYYGLQEPDKADDIRWFPVKELPENTIDYVREALETYLNGERYLEHGYTNGSLA